MKAEETPERWLERVWQRLAEAAVQGGDPFRHALLVTQDGNQPDARIVVLREVDRRQFLLSCYSDARSAKCRQVATSARVGWVFYDPERRLQARMRGHASLCAEPERLARSYARLTATQKREYLATLAPGALIEGPTNDDRLLAPAFAIIDCRIDEADLLQLTRSGHRRARLSRRADGSWQGAFVVP